MVIRGGDDVEWVARIISEIISVGEPVSIHSPIGKEFCFRRVDMGNVYIRTGFWIFAGLPYGIIRAVTSNLGWATQVYSVQSSFH